MFSSCSLAVLWPPCFPFGVSGPTVVPWEQPPGRQAAWSPLPPLGLGLGVRPPRWGPEAELDLHLLGLQSAGAGQRTAPAGPSAACPDTSPGPLLLLLWGACSQTDLGQRNVKNPINDCPIGDGSWFLLG